MCGKIYFKIKILLSIMGHGESKGRVVGKKHLKMKPRSIHDIKRRRYDDLIDWDYC
jgi:hypothetical protein